MVNLRTKNNEAGWSWKSDNAWWSEDWKSKDFKGDQEPQPKDKIEELAEQLAEAEYHLEVEGQGHIVDTMINMVAARLAGVRVSGRSTRIPHTCWIWSKCY